MLTKYIQAAMRHAAYEWIEEDRVWYASIPPLPGVWASADSREELPDELQSVLEGWIALGLRMNDPLPAIDGISLTFDLVR